MYENSPGAIAKSVSAVGSHTGNRAHGAHGCWDGISSPAGFRIPFSKVTSSSISKPAPKIRKLHEAGKGQGEEEPYTQECHPVGQQ